MWSSETSRGGGRSQTILFFFRQQQRRKSERGENQQLRLLHSTCTAARLASFEVCLSKGKIRDREQNTSFSFTSFFTVAVVVIVLRDRLRVGKKFKKKKSLFSLFYGMLCAWALVTAHGDNTRACAMPSLCRWPNIHSQEQKGKKEKKNKGPIVCCALPRVFLLPLPIAGCSFLFFCFIFYSRRGDSFLAHAKKKRERERDCNVRGHKGANTRRLRQSARVGVARVSWEGLPRVLSPPPLPRPDRDTPSDAGARLAALAGKRRA